MNYDKISNEEDLAFLKSIVCRLENYKCYVTFVSIYNSLEDKLMFETMPAKDIIKLINFTHDCYLDMNVCDLDILCGIVDDYVDEILNGDADMSNITNLCYERQNDYIN